jgi:DNA-binding Xre family transcriptional regulator
MKPESRQGLTLGHICAQTPHMHSPLNLAERIAGEIRAELGRRQMSQASLADALGLSRQRLSQILKNPGDIDLNRLEQICLALGVAPEELAGRAA